MAAMAQGEQGGGEFRVLHHVSGPVGLGMWSLSPLTLGPVGGGGLWLSAGR